MQFEENIFHFLASSFFDVRNGLFFFPGDVGPVSEVVTVIVFA